jgi:hypothetical protein
MTIPVKLRPSRYNKLKRRALEIFEREGVWLKPGDWSVMARFYPIRAAYSYLKRLSRFGLLERDPAGSVSYRISEKGRKRLSWLSRTLR